MIKKMGTVFQIMLITMSGVSAAHAATKPTWGQVICTAVAQTDAVTFAQQNHFLDNWDYENVPDAPYVEPKGTLACTLPVEVRTVSDENGGTAFELSVQLVNPPFKLGVCEVTYYDKTPKRRFAATGDGNGYVDLVPGSSDFEVSFEDFDQRKYDSDEFMVADGIDRTPAIAWAGEIRDDKPHVPIVTNCHLEF